MTSFFVTADKIIALKGATKVIMFLIGLVEGFEGKSILNEIADV